MGGDGAERGRGALICIPTYNEAENLPRIVPAVLEAVPEAHVLVVDDGSPDGTGKIADDLAARDPRVHVLHRAGKEGLGKAYLAAFAWALARDYAYVFELDADFSHDPKYLPGFCRRLADGADVVIGSRRVPGGGVENWGAARRLISWGGSFYARTVLGVPVRDLTGGFNGFRREALLRLDLDRVQSSGYCFQIELKYRAIRQGLRVVEAPIVFPDRVLGQSKMSGRIFLEALTHVWRLRGSSTTQGGDEGTGDSPDDADTRSASGRRAYRAVMGLVLFASILPFLSTRFPPLHDYPNHLVRTYILHHLAEVPSFRDVFVADWRAYPNLAIDVVMLVLLRVADVELAGKLFLMSLPLLLILGADRLARAIHGQPSWTAPLAGYLVWNAFFLYGFVNYLFGLGVFLLALAAWLGAQRTPTIAWGRLVLASVAALAAYLAHQTAFAFLAMAAAIWILVDRRPPFLLSALRGLVPLVPTVALWALTGLRETPSYMRWDGLADKLKGPFMLITTYDPLWDAALALVFMGALLFAVRRAAARSRPALIAGALFAVVFALAPTEGLGGWAVDRRFLLPAALLTLLAFRLDLQTRPLRFAFGLALTVVLVRGVAVTSTWRTLGADLERRVALLEALPQGASVFGFARVDGRKAVWTRQMGLIYLHQYAAIFRQAAVSGLFAHANQQPLRFRQPVDIGKPEQTRPPETFDWAAVFERYRYVFATKLDDSYRRYLASRCELVATQDDAAVFRDCRP